MQGVIRREWPALFKDENAAEGCFPVRPKGSRQMTQYGVAVLANGGTIACELRLVLGNLEASYYPTMFRTVHWFI